jgi:HEAT repeat protein
MGRLRAVVAGRAEDWLSGPVDGVAVGVADLDELAGWADDPDPKLRQWGLRLAAAVDDPRAVAVVARGCRDPDATVRHRAVALLAELDVGHPALHDALDDPDVRVRDCAGDRIGSYGAQDPRTALAVPRLVALLRDPETRATGGYAAEELQLVEAIPDLLEALADDDAYTRVRCATALAVCGHPAGTPVLLAELAAGRVLWPTIRILGQLREAAALEPLLRLAHGEDRTDVLRALGRLRDRRATPTLLAGLAAGELAAIRALGELGDPAAAAPLREAYANDSPEVRAEVVRAIGALGLPDAGAFLVAALADPAEEVRWAAVDAAPAFGTRGLQAALDRLAREEADPDLRADALQLRQRYFGTASPTHDLRVR